MSADAERRVQQVAQTILVQLRATQAAIAALASSLELLLGGDDPDDDWRCPACGHAKRAVVETMGADPVSLCEGCGVQS